MSRPPPATSTGRAGSVASELPPPEHRRAALHEGAHPLILLLDEPSEGLAPVVVEMLADGEVQHKYLAV